MTEETTVEWAVQYRTYIGGKFERTVPYDSEVKAREQVRKFNDNQGRGKGKDARVASRYVTKWKAS